MNEALTRMKKTIELLLDGVQTYSPEYMHGMPKKQYIKRANETLDEINKLLRPSEEGPLLKTIGEVERD